MNIDTPAKQVLFSTVRIQVETAGDPWYGTAFVYGHGAVDAQTHFLVTCRHVVDGGGRGHVFFTRATGEGEAAVGERIHVVIDDFQAKWFFHPDATIDLAVAPMSAFKRNDSCQDFIYATAIDNRVIPTAEQLRQLDVLEEVIFIGYPAGYYDQVNLLPLIRRGITASSIHLNYNGRPEFLVDGAAYFGSSGSPVFIIREHVDLFDKLRSMSKYRVHLLGVLSELQRATFLGQVNFIHPAATAEGVASARLLNLSVALKAHLIDETIAAYLERQSA